MPFARWLKQYRPAFDAEYDIGDRRNTAECDQMREFRDDLIAGPVASDDSGKGRPERLVN